MTVPTEQQVLAALEKAQQEIMDDARDEGVDWSDACDAWSITEDEILESLYEIVGDVGWGDDHKRVIWQALSPLILTGEVEIESWDEGGGWHAFAFRLMRTVA